jgi:hypothetical protein
MSQHRPRSIADIALNNESITNTKDEKPYPQNYYAGET